MTEAASRSGRSAAVLAWIAVLFLCQLTTPSLAFELFGRKFFEPASEETTIADPVRYTANLTQNGLNNDEEQALLAASELVAGQAEPVSGSLGLLLKARSDRDRLIGALYEQGRYGGLVRIYVAGREISTIDPTTQFDQSGPVPVEIKVDGGKRFTFGTVRFTGDVSDLNPADFGMVKGEVARSTLILQAQEEIVDQLKRDGHPYARIGNPNVEADHRLGTLDVVIHVIAGPTATLGSATVTGNEAVDGDFIEQQANVDYGAPYSPQRLREIRQRLLALGVFNSVIVREGDALAPDGSVPLIIEVKERKHRYFGVGATYSNADGFGLEGYWGHRNLFGRAEKLRVETSISRIADTGDLGGLNYGAAILFEKPGFLDTTSKFTANLRAVSENYDAFERRSIRGGVGVEKQLDEKQTLSVGLDADLSRIEEDTEVTEHLILSTPIEYAYDGSDDRFNPTRGGRLLLQLEPSHDLQSGASFLKAKGTVTGYFTPVENVTFAGKTTMGSITGASTGQIPADRRFYAGGGGSVRGYAFQAIGPRDADNRPVGGRSLFEASVEMRIQISETLGIVPFVDAGSVSTDEFPNFADVRYGAGIGVRYQTPFGPLRLDVGVPLDRRAGEDQWGIYAGIGQAF